MATPAAAHGEGARDRLSLGVLLGMLTLLLGGLAAFNAWQDPYAHFRGHPRILQYFGSEANIPLSALLEVDHLDKSRLLEADTALVGDSRSRHLSPERVAVVSGHRVVNLACGGATLEEALTLLTISAHRLPHLRTLIIGVPLERFTEAAQNNRCLETKPLADSALRYLLNWQMAQDSWRLLLTSKQPSTSKQGTTKTQSSPVQQQKVVRAWGQMYKAQKPEQVQRRLALLQQVLEPFRARGVRILFWRPPLNADVQRLIAEYKVQPTWDELLPQLHALGEVVDLTYEERIDGQMYEFTDPVHTKNAPQILLNLLSKVP